MAKQSGLHQIRGKVGEHSYYKQTGVASGLIRSINQGMSARVKTSEEYANTRLNNEEFGAAANTAGLLGQMVTPKFRPMILPFSQSRMAKEVLRLARENTGSWGQRTVSSSQTAQLADLLSAQSKRNVNEFVSLFVSNEGENTINCLVRWSAEQAAAMLALGITSLSWSFTVFDLASGNWNAMGQQMMSGYLQKGENWSYTTAVDPSVAGEEDHMIPYETFVPAAGHSGHSFVVAVVMPVRTINNVNHILQEYCSFKAFVLPDS